MWITWNNSVNRHDAQKSKIIEISNICLSTPKKTINTVIHRVIHIIHKKIIETDVL